MAPVIMWNFVSVDGLFEGDKSWSIDWFQAAWNDELGR